MADKLTIIEDEGAEQLAREGEFELAIPFSLYLYNDGGIRINVFPSLKKDAEEFLSLFPDDRMFSPEALGWARERFGGGLHDRGHGRFFLRLSREGRRPLADTSRDLPRLRERGGGEPDRV